MRGTILVFVCVFSFVGALILYSSFAVKAQEDSKWFACEKDADCVVVGVGCAIHAVNKQYKEEADLYYRHQNTQMDCEPQYNDISNLDTKCEFNKCQLVEKKEQIPAHE